jgi:hypothetical protein
VTAPAAVKLFVVIAPALVIVVEIKVGKLAVPVPVILRKSIAD